MEWLGVERRRLGTGLLAFGLIGMILAGIIAIGLFAGAVAARNLDDRISADQAKLSAALEKQRAWSPSDAARFVEFVITAWQAATEEDQITAETIALRKKLNKTRRDFWQRRWRWWQRRWRPW